MPAETDPEPSMDEILASIRRIIADDGPTGGAQTAVAETPVKDEPEEEEPLLLTERVDPLPPEAPQPMTDNHAEAEPEPAPAPDTQWIGEAAAADASDAFERLSRTNAPPPAPSEPVAMPIAGRTLEDVTRELLRPDDQGLARR